MILRFAKKKITSEGAWFKLEISVLEQTTIFFFAIIMGAVLSVAYDFVKILKIVLKLDGIKTFFLDILYFFAGGILTFLFLIAFNDGEVRFYVIIGEIVGFYLYRLMVGTAIVKFVCRFLRLTRKIAVPILNFLRLKIKKIVLFLASPLLLLYGKISCIAKKSLQISKKMLYNPLSGILTPFRGKPTQSKSTGSDRTKFFRAKFARRPRRTKSRKD